MTSNELITRKNIELALLNKGQHSRRYKLGDIWELDYYEIREVLDDIDADAQPVVHGEWIPVDSYSAFGGDEATWMAHGNPVAFYYCSHCKEQAYAGEDGESLITEYCPNCGAKMDGKGTDHVD